MGVRAGIGVRADMGDPRIAVRAPLGAPDGSGTQQRDARKGGQVWKLGRTEGTPENGAAAAAAATWESGCLAKKKKKKKSWFSCWGPQPKGGKICKPMQAGRAPQLGEFGEGGDGTGFSSDMGGKKRRDKEKTSVGD